MELFNALLDCIVADFNCRVRESNIVMGPVGCLLTGWQLDMPLWILEFLPNLSLNAGAFSS